MPHSFPHRPARLLLGLALAWFAPLTRADMTIVQEIENLQDSTPQGKEQITLYVSGQRLRLDKGQSLTRIILHDRQITYSIMHETRQYVALPHSLLGAAAKATSQEDGLENMTIESPGKQRTISGYSCQLVRLKSGDGLVTEIWMARDTLDPSTFLAEFKGLMEFGMSSPLSVIQKHPELRGIPIQVTEFQGVTALRRSTVRRLDLSPLSDAIFEIPAGYQELKMSDLPARVRDRFVGQAGRASWERRRPHA